MTRDLQDLAFSEYFSEFSEYLLDYVFHNNHHIFHSI